jgi:8-oxo-dGTP pyrophosphatase MutT (NUDIX family)
MIHEISAGGVVYCRNGNADLRVLLILDKHNNWGFPKGHLEDDESEEQAAHREIVEETGLNCTLGPLVERIQYPVFKKGEWRHKTVIYFLARHSCAEPVPQLDEGISQARWVTSDEAFALLPFEQTRAILHRALDMLATETDNTPDE